MNNAVKKLKKAIRRENELISACLGEIKLDNEAGVYGSFGQLEKDYFCVIAAANKKLDELRDSLKALKMN